MKRRVIRVDALRNGGQRKENGRAHPRRPYGTVKWGLDVQIDVAESVKVVNRRVLAQWDEIQDTEIWRKRQESEKRR